MLKTKKSIIDINLEPNSSSTASSKSSFNPHFKALKLNLCHYKKPEIDCENINLLKNSKNNLGFSLGKEFEEKYEILDVLGKVKKLKFQLFLNLNFKNRVIKEQF